MDINPISTPTSEIIDLTSHSRLPKLKYVAIFLLCSIVIIVLIVLNVFKLSFGELWGGTLEKVNYKIDKLDKSGFKVNITYLYFMSYNKDKQDDIVKDNIGAFLDTIEHLYSYKATNISDYLDNNVNNNYYLDNKVSLKLNQIGENYKESLHNIKQLLDHALKHNIFIWIACHKKEDLQNELETYLVLLNLGYRNVGITLACYHKDIDARVDKVLDRNGTIRLVKGYYRDGEIKDHNIITKNYIRNACKLIEHYGYHQLATHDFREVIYSLYLKYKNTKHDFETNDYIEFGFFYNSLKHVKYQMKSYKIHLKHKCCLVTYGNNIKYLRSNIRDISVWNMFKLKTIL